MSSISFEHSSLPSAHEGTAKTEPVITYDKSPGHRWYNLSESFGPEMTAEEINRFESDPTVLVPEFEKLPYPGEEESDQGFLYGRVPVVGREGYQEISLYTVRYSNIVQAIHRAIHKRRPNHKPVAGRVVTNH